MVSLVLKLHLILNIFSVPVTILPPGSGKFVIRAGKQAKNVVEGIQQGDMNSKSHFFSGSLI